MKGSKSLKRKTALITGASRGIGKAISEKFAQNGYDLYLTCHQNLDRLLDAAKALEEKYHITCHCYQFSIDDESAVDEMFLQIDTLDVLVNNAGIAYIGLLSEMSYAQWNQVIGTNLNGCFLTARRSIPLMLKNQKGKILNISSVWGNVGASMEVAYSASKGGVNSFTKALAKELAPSNIQVNAIACGVIDTDMNHCFDEEDMRALIDEIPADRIGKPEEVAELVYQICAGNEYLTGQIITLDGGWI